jgi:hypothetical protein
VPIGLIITGYGIYQAAAHARTLTAAVETALTFAVAGAAVIALAMVAAIVVKVRARGVPVAAPAPVPLARGGEVPAVITVHRPALAAAPADQAAARGGPESDQAAPEPVYLWPGTQEPRLGHGAGGSA